MNKAMGSSIGGVLGLLLAVLIRPSLPMIGQPPIGVSIQTLFNSSASMDRAYAAEFWPTIIICILIGIICGFVASKFIPVR